MENINTNKTAKSRESSYEELYAKRDYSGAVNYLLKNKQQFDSGTFHYNLGTTYAKLSEFGAARFHLEKAISYGMYNSATINNLNFVKNKINAEDLSTSTSFSDQFINTSLNIPREAFLSMSLALMLLALIYFKLKKIRNKIAIALFISISLIPFLFSLVYLNQIDQAVALKDIPVMEGPSKIFQEKGQIKSGAKIIIGEFKEGWFFVKYPISMSGWVSKDNLGIY
jgi:tetratricopeptide (TPR) repeat protein